MKNTFSRIPRAVVYRNNNLAIYVTNTRNEYNLLVHRKHKPLFNGTCTNWKVKLIQNNDSIMETLISLNNKLNRN